MQDSFANKLLDWSASRTKHAVKHHMIYNLGYILGVFVGF